MVINMSTSRMTEDVAKAAGARVVRTAVGEVNVAERMKDEKASFGGEGNGGVMDPLVHYGRDAIVGMGLILEHLAVTGKPVSQLASALPKWYMVKSRIEIPTARSREMLRRLKAESHEAEVNTEDGLRLDWAERWVHLRASNTEPVMRVIAEARREGEAEALVEQYTRRVQELLKS
ncbi:MAG: hypothetical protein M5U26_27020 [Planctomycetota bacterium]|nr:hypothetical protein [Planctomycetota bacterium]